MRDLRVGVLALARSTFDVPFAEQMAAAAFGTLDSTGIQTFGPRDLLFEHATTEAAIDELAAVSLDLVVLLQVTFSDASMAEAIGRQLDTPLVLWAFPEARTGGRLRLNSFCGINLAGHALNLDGRRYHYLYTPPDDKGVGDELRRMAGVEPPKWGDHVVPDVASLSADAVERARGVAARLSEARIGVIGDHPVGFHPCAYDPDDLGGLTGVTVERLELDDLFGAARSVPEGETDAIVVKVGALSGLDRVDQGELAASLKLYPALRSIADRHKLSGLAVRCWPECFTEYGGANCAPAGLMNDDLIPTACEADVYGNVTALMLQWLGGQPALVADLVDVDVADGTGVLWHCGKAPLSMADPEATPAATVHSNRRKPLLNEFPLKPGRITIARLSKAGGHHHLVIGGGEMERAPLAFSGTAGVVRFDRPAADVVDTVMYDGLEHHYGFVYADVRDELRALAALWGIHVIDL